MTSNVASMMKDVDIESLCLKFRLAFHLHACRRAISNQSLDMAACLGCPRLSNVPATQTSGMHPFTRLMTDVPLTAPDNIQFHLCIVTCIHRASSPIVSNAVSQTDQPQIGIVTPCNERPHLLDLLPSTSWSLCRRLVNYCVC